MGTEFRKRRPTPTSSVRDWGASLGYDPPTTPQYGEGQVGFSDLIGSGGGWYPNTDQYRQTYDEYMLNTFDPIQQRATGAGGIRTREGNLPSADEREFKDPFGPNNFEGANRPGDILPGSRPNFDPAVAAAFAAYMGSATPADDAAMQAEMAQQDIDLKEMALREAMLNGDVAEATRLIGEIQAAKDYMKRSFQDYRNLVSPVYDSAISNSGLIQDKNTVPLADIAAAEQNGIQEAFMGADADISKEARKIGADATAEAAAREIAGELTGLYMETSQGRQDDAQRILQALETAAFESAKAFKAEDMWNIDNRERVDQAERDQDLRNAQKDLEDLEFRRQALDLDKERTAIQHAEALRQLRESGEELPYMDAVGFGQLTAAQYMNNAMDSAGIALDRQSIMHGVLAEAWKVGVFSPAEFGKWLNEVNENGEANRDFFGYPPLTDGEVEMLINTMGAYGRGRDQYGSLSSIASTTGSSKLITGVSGGGQPDNMAHAAEARRGDGPYGARAVRVSGIKNQIMAQYDVNYLGQWRDLDAEVTKDRDPNSDHYSGGALDFSGTEAEMIRLKNYLETRNDVDFARIHGNPRHVHVSFKL
jgi:hypothetical protein